MLTLIVTGKMKETFYRQACAEYEKRLKAYGGIQIIELPEVHLPDNPSRAQIDAALKKEADAGSAKAAEKCVAVHFYAGGKAPFLRAVGRKAGSGGGWAGNPTWCS